MRRQQPGRPADRSERILRELRGEIVSGHLPPGSRIQTRIEIEQRFNASSVTVHRVLSRLAKDGFVRVDRRLGTYVSDKPPHLSRFALVFPNQPAPDHWSRYYSSLLRASALVAKDHAIEIVPYYDLNGHVDSPDYVRLVEDIGRQTVAGIAFVSPPYLIENTPVVLQPGIPRVTLAQAQFHGLPAVGQDTDKLLDVVFSEIAASGRRRVALIVSAGRDLKPIVAAVESHGLVTKPYWKLRFSLETPHTAREVAHLLMQAPRSERPDALYIDDDNVIEAVALGLMDAEVDVPGDVEVFAHTNLPWPPATGVPMRKFGFDARHIMARAIEHLESQRRGEHTDPITVIDPQFGPA